MDNKKEVRFARVRVLNWERFLRPKNALKIGMINKECFVVTLSLSLDGSGEEDLRIHTLKLKSDDKIEYVPKEAVLEMIKMMKFY